jgi:hypothetical protein
MKRSALLIAFASCLTVWSSGAAWAGAPQPDTRAGDFEHVCRGGPNKGNTCTVPNESTDCPDSECVVLTLSNVIKGTLTIVAHDAVTDWKNGGATNQALTVLLEVKAPGGTQILAATYQDLAAPTNPPEAPSNVISIAMDEFALKTLSGAVSGLVFVQPEGTLAQQLQTLFASNGTPVLVATDRRVVAADHTADGLATVLRFKVKIQFLDAV